MASAQPELAKSLREELTCPVCLDLYRDPYLLPCGHNFCKICLDRLRQQAERGRFRCPECRNSHRCSANFQKNFKLSNISDDCRHHNRATSSAATSLKPRDQLSSFLSAQRSRSMLAVPCDYCPSVAATAAASDPGAGRSGASAPFSQEDGDKQESSAAAPAFAVKTCLKCEVSMCPEHVKPHLELPVFREHPLTEPMNDFWKRKCPDHDEIYRYYCMDDKVCVCNACTIEGGHLGHTIKTLRNTMKDLRGSLDKQVCRVERKHSAAERKLQEQKEKERQNKKFIDDSEQGLTRLGEEMKAKVLSFVARLRECTRTHCDTNGPAIQKNITRIRQDQARLQEVRCGIESIMQENDPFRFIEMYKTSGKQCRRQLRKNMFYPEYVDMETELLGGMMEIEMRKFLDHELPCLIVATISTLCHLSDLEEEEQEQNEEESVEEDNDEDDDDDDELDESSVEEMRSEGEEEDEEEEEDEDEDQEQSELADELYSPEDLEDVEEDEDEDEEDEEEDEGEREV